MRALVYNDAKVHINVAAMLWIEILMIVLFIVMQIYA